jgi:hypothetical protein
MRLSRLLTIIVPLVFSCATLIGQNLPNFSGKWTLDTSGSGIPGDPADGVAPQVTLVVTQSPDQLRVQTQVDEEIESVSYSFDDPATPVGTSGSDRVRMDAAYAEWRDGRLEMTRELTISGKAVTQKQTWSLDPTSRELIVEMDLLVQHGYEALAPESVQKGRTRAVYRRIDR